MKESKVRLVFAPFHGFHKLLASGIKSIISKDTVPFIETLSDYTSSRIKINVFKQSKLLLKQQTPK